MDFMSMIEHIEKGGRATRPGKGPYCLLAMGGEIVAKSTEGFGPAAPAYLSLADIGADDWEAVA